jgi:DNA topoisomerase VI subunit A
MSTKGMSVVAARMLLDRLAGQVDNIFVLRDFDVSGFSIFGTLGTDSRRYVFENDLTDKIVDIGLRLEDIEAMGLEAETVEVDNREARRAKLEEHGATDDEIEFPRTRG